MANRKRNNQVKSWVTEEEKRLIDEKMAQLPTQSYMDANGVMQTGWKQISGKWYYFSSGGDMKTGWLQQGSTWNY